MKRGDVNKEYEKSSDGNCPAERLIVLLQDKLRAEIDSGKGEVLQKKTPIRVRFG